MTHPSPDTIERTKDTLWVTDAELIRRSGIPEHKAREILRMLDKDPRASRFPQKNKFFADRRYWPAVKAYFDRAGGLTMDPPRRTANGR